MKEMSSDDSDLDFESADEGSVEDDGSISLSSKYDQVCTNI
jgi:hypothetical protein